MLRIIRRGVENKTKDVTILLNKSVVCLYLRCYISDFPLAHKK